MKTIDMLRAAIQFKVDQGGKGALKKIATATGLSYAGLSNTLSVTQNRNIPRETTETFATYFGITEEHLIALGRHILQGKDPNNFVFWQDLVDSEFNVVMEKWLSLSVDQKNEVAVKLTDLKEEKWSLLADLQSGKHGAPFSEDRFYYIIHQGFKSIDYHAVQYREKPAKIIGDCKKKYIKGGATDREVWDMARLYGAERLKVAYEASKKILDMK